jgi:flagellar motor switch protein FliG
MKQNILEEYYFKMMSQKYHNLSNRENKLFNFLISLNDEQVFYLINTEPPKVIALAVDQLEEKRKMNILNRLPNDIKHSVIMELGNLNSIPLEGVVNVAQELKKKAAFIPGPKEFSRGGGKSIASILNQMDPDSASQYLEQMATEDPDLYTQVKKHFLSFDDLLTMPNHIMSVFWRNPEIDVDELAKALKGLDEETVQTILAYMPKRKQQMFSSIEQPLSKKEINKSQLAFVQLARNMGQSGDLNLDDVLSADDDDLVE